MKLNPLKNGASTKGKVAYLLFDDSKEKAEIFFPFQDKGVVLLKNSGR